MLTILKFCDADKIFSNTMQERSFTQASYSSIEHLCVYDLLRWILFMHQHHLRQTKKT
jgi:hypothetical protein